MRINRFLLLTLLLVFLLSSCYNTGAETVVSSKSIYIGLHNGLSNTFLNRNEIDINIISIKKGKVLPQRDNNIVTLCYVNNNDGENINDFYIRVFLKDDILNYYLGKYELRKQSNNVLNLLDIDRDGTDEILVSLEIAGNGASLVQVFDVNDNNLMLLNDLNEFDIGLIGLFKNDSILCLDSFNKGFSETIDISGYNSNDLADYESLTRFYYDPIDAFTLIIEYNDNVPEIICNRIAYTGGNGIILNLQLTFGYNEQTEELQLKYLDNIDNT